MMVPVKLEESGPNFLEIFCGRNVFCICLHGAVLFLTFSVFVRHDLLYYTYFATVLY